MKNKDRKMIVGIFLILIAYNDTYSENNLIFGIQAVANAFLGVYGALLLSGSIGGFKK